MKCYLLLTPLVNFLSFITFFTITATAVAKEIVSETGERFPMYNDCISYIPGTNCTSYVSIVMTFSLVLKTVVQGCHVKVKLSQCML
jgi:hypothetical protein